MSKPSHTAQSQFLFDVFQEAFSTKAGANGQVGEKISVVKADPKPASENRYTEEEQRALLGDKNPDKRKRVAHEPKLPQHMQTSLAEDNDWEVRMSLAANHSISTATNEILSQDCNLKVRCFLALQPKLTDRQQKRLSRDVEPEVRRLMACNPMCTRETRQRLQSDSDPDAAALAHSHDPDRQQKLVFSGRTRRVMAKEKARNQVKDISAGDSASL